MYQNYQCFYVFRSKVRFSGCFTSSSLLPTTSASMTLVVKNALKNISIVYYKDLCMLPSGKPLHDS